MVPDGENFAIPEKFNQSKWGTVAPPRFFSSQGQNIGAFVLDSSINSARKLDLCFDGHTFQTLI